MTQQDFVRIFWPAALEIQDKTGIPAMFIITQCALESGWGTHAPNFNFFGKKAKKDATGHPIESSQLAWTWEVVSNRSDADHYPNRDSTKDVQLQNGKWKIRVQDYFRSYDTAAEAMKDYVKLLMNSRYSPALKNKDDWEKYAYDVIKAGYATEDANSYVTKLKKIWEMVKTDLQGIIFDSSPSDQTGNDSTKPPGGKSKLMLWGFLAIAGVALASSKKSAR